MQGSTAPLRLRHSAGPLTDGAGLVLLRRCWDALGIGAWLDGHTAAMRGRYRPSLVIERWAALLLYGGGRMDDLRRFGSRGIRRLFGWKAVPDPTTFGRWLSGGAEGPWRGSWMSWYGASFSCAGKPSAYQAR